MSHNVKCEIDKAGQFFLTISSVGGREGGANKKYDKFH